MYRLRDRGLMVTEVFNLLLILALAMAGYAAGRLHGQLGYRHGYRYGYRQGYFDGDRASWNRRRRELQAAVASVLTTPAHKRAEAFPSPRSAGTTYTSAIYDDEDADDLDIDDRSAARDDTESEVAGVGKHARERRSLVTAASEQ
jgi:hypothetical protein